MIRNNRQAGFTLIELMIVVAIIAIIAAVAIPKLLTARISANENAAIATLRSIAAAQQQLQASAAIDTDADGGGEYGYFGELAGTNPMRIYNGNAAPNNASVGIANQDELNPPFLATPFGNVVADQAGDGVVVRQGYVYKIFLPDNSDPGAGNAIQGVPELVNGGIGGAGAAGAALANWGSANSEVFWCAYAWPVDAERTGNRTFFINTEGDVIAYGNRDQQYSGLAVAPPVFNAALWNADPGTVATSMDSGLGLAAMGRNSVDGNVWVQVGN